MRIQIKAGGVSTGYEGITYVVACGGQKLDRPAPAAELYAGSLFRHTYDAAVRCAELDVEAGCARAARVLILSAKHGLVEPDRVLEPYDLRLAQPGSVTAAQLAEQAATLGIGWDERWGRGSDVYALLPRPYLARLDEALRTLDVYVADVYEGCVPEGAHPGVGWLKRVHVNIRRPDAVVAEQPGGLTVWPGADVQGLWWGTPVLVSYDRLRDATCLPRAAAPWALDSGGFTEVARHGRWTIPLDDYLADIRRYRAMIGHLEWVAPQDWPASAALLERTGRAEGDHQRLTTASVTAMRAAAPDIDVITVVTGSDVAGYLRHIDIYRDAGVHLTAETLPIGVGALVGRRPAEAAAIVRALHDAGLRRLHGFGVKGSVVDLVGHLLGSIDSASWSRIGGLCPHGVVKHEANCPIAAKEWAAAQRTRAAVAGDVAGDVAGVQLDPFDIDAWARLVLDQAAA